VDVPHIGANKDHLFPVGNLPVLCGRVPVADIPPRQVERDGFCLSSLQLNFVEAAENAPGVVFATELDELLLC
jgi:hypothetical protein